MSFANVLTGEPKGDDEAQDSSSDCVDETAGTLPTLIEEPLAFMLIVFPGTNSDASPRFQEPLKNFVEALAKVGTLSTDILSKSTECEGKDEIKEDAEREAEQFGKIDQDELRSLEYLVTATGRATEETEQTCASIASQEDTPSTQTVVDEPPTQALLPAIPASIKPGLTHPDKLDALPASPSAKTEKTGSGLLDALFKKYYHDFNATVPRQAPGRRSAALPSVNAEDMLSSSLTLRLRFHDPPTSTMAKILPPLTPHQAADKTLSLPPKHEPVRTDTNRAKLDAILDMLKATSKAQSKGSDDQNAGIRQGDDTRTSPGPSSESVVSSETKQPSSTVEYEPQGAPDTTKLPSLSGKDHGSEVSQPSPSTDPLGPLIVYESSIEEKGNGRSNDDRPQSPWLKKFPDLDLEASSIPMARTAAPLFGSHSDFVPVQRRDRDRSLRDPVDVDAIPMDIGEGLLDVEEDTMNIDAEDAMNGRCPGDEMIMAPDVPDVEMGLVLYMPEVEAASMAISQEMEMSDAYDSSRFTSDVDDVEMSDAGDYDTDMSSVDYEDQLNGDAMDCEFSPTTVSAPLIPAVVQNSLRVRQKAESAKTSSKILAKCRAGVKLHRRQQHDLRLDKTLKQDKDVRFSPDLTRGGRISTRHRWRGGRRRVKLALRYWRQKLQMALPSVAPVQSGFIGTPSEPARTEAASRKEPGTGEGQSARDASKRRQDRIDTERYRKSR